jgi:hypothetical protein
MWLVGCISPTVLVTGDDITDAFDAEDVERFTAQ